MRYTIAITLALLAAPSAQAQLQLEFVEPANLMGEGRVTAVSWAAIFIEEGHDMVLTLPATAKAVSTNLTTLRVATPSSFTELPASRETSEVIVQPGSIRLIARQGGATLAVHANGPVRFQGNNELVTLGPEGVKGPLIGTAARGWSGWATLSTQGVATKSTGNQELHLDGLSVSAVEWFNMEVQCTMTYCPLGGGSSWTGANTQGFVVGTSVHHFERLEGNAILDAHWPRALSVLAASSLAVDMSGEIHLPLVAGSTCESCPPMEGQALRVAGNLSLRDLRPSEKGFSGTLSGDFESVRLDESWISPSELGAASLVAVAGVSIIVIIKLLLLPLFTRLTKTEALEHPKRQRIFAYIQEHPGANFREVSRQTEIAAGTVRHHLTVLERAGHIVEHPHQGTIRLFENHGKFDANWVDAVLLREPPLAKLHAWIQEHPGSAQKDVLEAMEQAGWSRSTTQHRLARLVSGGVVSLRLQGRLKIYGLPAPVPKAAGLQWRPAQPALHAPA